MMRIRGREGRRGGEAGGRGVKDHKDELHSTRDSFSPGEEIDPKVSLPTKKSEFTEK